MIDLPRPDADRIRHAVRRGDSIRTIMHDTGRSRQTVVSLRRLALTNMGFGPSCDCGRPEKHRLGCWIGRRGPRDDITGRGEVLASALGVKLQAVIPELGLTVPVIFTEISVDRGGRFVRGRASLLP